MPERTDRHDADGRGRGLSRGTGGNESPAGAGRPEGARRGGAGDGEAGAGVEKVLVQVCLVCGTERIFDTEPLEPGMRCPKCGGQVFRTFYDVPGQNEAHEDFRAATERDLSPDSAASDVSVDDVIDLNNP